MKDEMNDEMVAGHVFALPCGAIHRSPWQVRREAPADPDLVASIAAHGLVHPLTVREDGKGGYEIIAGHRRFAAYKVALPGAPVPCTVLSVSDREAEDLLVSENFMRLDLSLVEKAVTIAALREHGRSVAQVAELVRMSERQIYRFLAIGTLAQPWREFLHTWDSTYDEALRLARLPSAVQLEAWNAMLGFLADKLFFVVRKGSEEDDERARATFIAGLEGSADDKATMLEYIVNSAAMPGDLPDAAAAEALVRRWFEDEKRGLPAFLGEQRLLDPKTCPFDCKDCKGCVKRSDVQINLFDEDDPARVTPRCHDADCWAAKTAAAAEANAAAQSSSDSCLGEPETNSGNDSGITGATSAAESSTTPTAVAEPENNGTSSSTQERQPAHADRPEHRVGEYLLSARDFGVRMGAVWAVGMMLDGSTLEEILLSIAHLRFEGVRCAGWRSHVLELGLPRLKQNREAAREALAALKEMW